MSNPRTEAFVSVINLFLHGELRQDQYSCIRDGLDYIEPLAERDKVLENMWHEFADVPMNPETECMEASFLDFPAGTPPGRYLALVRRAAQQGCGAPVVRRCRANVHCNRVVQQLRKRNRDALGHRHPGFRGVLSSLRRAAGALR